MRYHIKYHSILWVIDDISQILHDIFRELGIMVNHIDRFRGVLQDDQLGEYSNLMVEEHTLLRCRVHRDAQMGCACSASC
jgi:hypothetical protein